MDVAEELVEQLGGDLVDAVGGLDEHELVAFAEAVADGEVVDDELEEELDVGEDVVEVILGEVDHEPVPFVHPRLPFTRDVAFSWRLTARSVTSDRRATRPSNSGRWRFTNSAMARSSISRTSSRR